MNSCSTFACSNIPRICNFDLVLINSRVKRTCGRPLERGVRPHSQRVQHFQFSRNEAFATYWHFFFSPFGNDITILHRSSMETFGSRILKLPRLNSAVSSNSNPSGRSTITTSEKFFQGPGGALIPSDQTLVDRFEAHYDASPHDFAPIE